LSCENYDSWQTGPKITTNYNSSEGERRKSLFERQQQTDSVEEISRKVAKKILHKYLPRFHLISDFP